MRHWPTMSTESAMTARQIANDIKKLQLIIMHRVDTWPIFGSNNHTDPYLRSYHANSGEHSVKHLAMAADNLLLKDWSHVLEQPSNMLDMCRCAPMHNQPRHVANVNANVAMHQQVLAFHFKLAELLEDLSPETLQNLQQQHRMRDLCAKLQTDLVQKSRQLACGSCPEKNF